MKLPQKKKEETIKETDKEVTIVFTGMSILSFNIRNNNCYIFPLNFFIFVEGQMRSRLQTINLKTPIPRFKEIVTNAVNTKL